MVAFEIPPGAWLLIKGAAAPFGMNAGHARRS